MDAELEQLQKSLLWRVHFELTPEDGDEAFERHILLAVRVNRAALLWGTGDSDQERWVQFVTTFFPGDRYTERIARLLWTDWRNGLVKDGSPRSDVAIAHLHPDWHLTSVDDLLCVNLESLCHDYEHAVRQAVRSLESDEDRRAVVLSRWRDWEVRLVAKPTSSTGTRHTGPVEAFPLGEARALSAESDDPGARHGGTIS